MNKHAFTLSETLITLGIIGVVASMTLPSVINKYQEKVTITKLKKIYSILSQCYLTSVQKYGTPDEWGITGRDAGSSDENEDSYTAQNAIFIRDRLFENVKKIRDCNNAKDQKACGMSDKYYRIDGAVNNEIGGSTAKTSSAFMVDGSSVMIIANPAGEYRGPGVLSKTYAIIYIDLNGVNFPNMYGKDLFMFYLTKQNIIPAGTEKETGWPFSTCYSHGGACTAWVIYNENMDYLKCKDLSWTGKKKCK